MFNKKTIMPLTALFVFLCVTQYAVCRPQSDGRPAGLQLRSDRIYHIQPKDHGFYSSKPADDNPQSRYVEISRKKAIEPSIHINDKTAHIKKSDILKVHNKRPSNYKYIESEKKYFDYFPIEDVQLKSDPNEHNIRFILLSPEDLEKKLEKAARNAKTLGERRSKREAVKRPEEGVPVEIDTYDEGTKKTKRELGVLVTNGGYRIVYISSGGFYNAGLPQNLRFPQQSSMNVPSVASPPIQGNYYNAFTPNANFIQSNRVNIDNRFDFPEESPVVWSISYGPPRAVKPTTRAPPTTSSTFPPLINGPEDNIEDDDDDVNARPVPERGSRQAIQSRFSFDR